MYLHLCIYILGTGNRLASTLYELDPQVQAEIEKASQSQKPVTSAGSKGTSVLEQHTAGNHFMNPLTQTHRHTDTQAHNEYASIAAGNHSMSILFQCSLNAL